MSEQRYKLDFLTEKCRKCKYRGILQSFNTLYCAYISCTGHSRGCSPENCKHFVKGNPELRDIGRRVF